MSIKTINLPPWPDEARETFKKIHDILADSGYTYDLAVELLSDIAEIYKEMAMKCSMSELSYQRPGVRWDWK